MLEGIRKTCKILYFQILKRVMCLHTILNRPKHRIKARDLMIINLSIFNTQNLMKNLKNITRVR